MKTKLNLFVYTLPKSYIGGGCTLRERKDLSGGRRSWVREAAGINTQEGYALVNSSLLRDSFVYQKDKLRTLWTAVEELGK